MTGAVISVSSAYSVRTGKAARGLGLLELEEKLVVVRPEYIPESWGREHSVLIQGWPLISTNFILSAGFFLRR